jgi:hypothetical protein
MIKTFKITLKDSKNQFAPICEFFEVETSDSTLARVKAINYLRLMRGHNGWSSKRYKSFIELVEKN